MNSSTINIAGSLVLWDFSKGTRLSALRQALEDNGFGNHAPACMTEASALRAALADEYPGCDIDKVVGEDGTCLEVCKLDKGEGKKNSHPHVVTATLGIGRIQTDLCDWDLEHRLWDKFEDLTQLVPVSQLTATMVKIIFSLGGVSMKDSGGCYWCPYDSMDRWKALADAIEKTGPKNRINSYHVVLDENSVKGMRENLAREIQREAIEIDATMSDPDTGARAAGTARKRAEFLRDKISSYESSFGLVMTDLKQHLEDATNIEAKATLLDCGHQLSLLQFAQ